jgi:hypothetical protein
MGCNETADAPGCSTRVSEAVLTNIKKGAHVLVEGSLISSTYEQANGKGKKAQDREGRGLLERARQLLASPQPRRNGNPRST